MCLCVQTVAGGHSENDQLDGSFFQRNAKKGFGPDNKTLAVYRGGWM